MFDPDNNDAPKRPRSLLSLSQPARGKPSTVRPGSLLSVVAEEPSETPDPVPASGTDIPERTPVAPERARSAHVEQVSPAPGPRRGDALRNRWSFLRAGHDDDVERQDDDEPVTAGERPRREAAETYMLPPRENIPEAVPPPSPPPYRAAAERHEQEDDYWRPLIDPLMVVGGVTGSKKLIALTTVLGALAGVAVALAIPKMYAATAELLVDPRDLAIVERDLTSSAGGLPSDATLAIVENQVRVLTSGTVLNKVVDRLNLTRDPEFNEQSESFGIGALISELRSLLSPGGAGGSDSMRTLVVENLAKSLDVYREGRTFVISVEAETRDAEKSALIANTLSEVFLETQGEIQAGTAGRATGELTSRLDELRKGVEAAERAVEKFKAEHDIVDAQGRLITDDEIIKLNDQLSVARARTIELNARAASARSLNVNAVLEGSLPELVTSQVMTELRSQYATIKQESDRLAVRLGPRHPQRIAAEAQLAGAREQLQAELRRIVSSIQVEQQRAAQLEQDLASRLTQLKARQANLSEELVTLRELERDVTSKRSVYEAFLLRSRETGEQQSLNTANVSVISQAYPPLLPTGPSRMVITLAGALLGFMAGIALGGARGAWASLRERRPEPRLRQTRPAASYAAAAENGSAFRAGARSTEWDRDHATRNRTPSDPYGARPIDGIREELREFRAAVRDLAESRGRRRGDY